MDSFVDAQAAAAADPADAMLAAEALWVWRHDRHFRYTEVMPVTTAPNLDPMRTVGRTRWELPGSRPLASSWAEHRDALARRLPFHNFRYLVFADTASPRCLAESGEPQFDDSGSFTGYRGITRDVTQQWQQHCRLQEAQGLLQAAATIARFGAWSVDVRTREVTWTREVGLDTGDRRGGPAPAQDLLRVYAPEHRDVLREAFDRCVGEGASFDVEVQALTARGRRKWIRVIGAPVRNPAGQVVRVQGAYQDIHKTKVAAEAQRRADKRLRGMLDSLTDGFLTLDRQWRITYVNPAAEEILGMSAGQLLGQVMWDAFPGSEHGTFGRRYREALEHDRVCRFEAEYAPMSMWFRVSAFPSRDGLAISFTDITAARTTREELTGFTLAVAHDLRAPLAAIEGFSRALAEGLPPLAEPKLRHYAGRIRAAVTRMGQQLDALLELSRVGRAEMQPRRVDLTALARCTVESLRAGEPGRPADVHVAEGLVAWGDARLLRTLLENLLGNAWKFSGRDGAGRIDVGQREDGAFFVRDDGPGFDAGRAEELFRPFGRLHGNGQVAGFGLGLASARRVVERHGGTLWAESAPGAGACFWFRLPGPQNPAASPSRRESDATR